MNYESHKGSQSNSLYQNKTVLRYLLAECDTEWSKALENFPLLKQKLEKRFCVSSKRNKHVNGWIANKGL